MIEQLILVLHILIALAIVALILLQQGKGADMGASFGAGGSQTLFGPTGGGNVLTQATAILATLFFVTSFGLAIIAKQKANAIADEQLMSEGARIEALAETVDPVESIPEAEGASDYIDQAAGYDSGLYAEDDIPALEPEDSLDQIPQ